MSQSIYFAGSFKGGYFFLVASSTLEKLSGVDSKAVSLNMFNIFFPCSLVLALISRLRNFSSVAASKSLSL